MIGQVLQKINRLPLANDYNKLVEVIQPFQNLQIGTGLNGVIASNGISISVSPANIPSNDFPFKVTEVDDTTLNVQFGRVYEVNPTNPLSGYTEIQWDESYGTFTPTSGFTVDVTGVTSGTIDIAINRSLENPNDPYNFIVDLDTNIISNESYFSVQPICNFSITSGTITLEQILVGDFSYSIATVDNYSINVTTSGDLQIRNFQGSDQVEQGVLDILSVSDGELVAADTADKYELLVRVTSTDGEVKAVGYMPFSTPENGSNPADDLEQTECGSEPYPGGAGDNNIPEVPWDDGSTTNIYGEETSNDDSYPGKSNDCW